MSFETIIGQKAIVANMESMLASGRISHAYVFTGPEGIGKKTLAEAFSGALLCTGNREERPCGECTACIMKQNGSNPDYRELETDAASIGVEEIRKLQSDIIIKPLYSRRKVYLIADASKMTVQAQNCLLKTLEEPPGEAVLILTTSNYGSLLETIRSRSVRFNFVKNTHEEVYNAVASKLGYRPENIDFIVSYADGNIGEALRLSESKDFANLRNGAVDIVLRLAKADLLDVYGVYNFFEGHREEADVVFDVMLSMYRDLLVARYAWKENILINSDKKDIILSNASGFTPEMLVRSIDTIERARRNLKQNANFQLAIEVMLMKLQEVCS